MTGRIFNIQRYSTHDGPGIRTTVFFKGCSLRCVWCHNPESLDGRPSLEFNPELCISCGACADSCRRGVHEKGNPAADRKKCVGCGECVRNCFSGALTLAGIDMDAETAMEEILTDLPYFEASGGGVTFSGGECMLQIDFLEMLCALCRSKGINAAVDTAGHLPWAYFERILPYDPLFLYDIKAIDPEVHRRLTGADNSLILENLEKLMASGARIWIRVPCVPGGNIGEMDGIAGWLAGKPAERVELLAYHTLGEGKRKLLGLRDGAGGLRAPDGREMEEILEKFLEHGIISTRIG